MKGAPAGGKAGAPLKGSMYTAYMKGINDGAQRRASSVPPPNPEMTGADVKRMVSDEVDARERKQELERKLAA